MNTDQKISCIVVHDDPDIQKLLEQYVAKTFYLQLKGSFDNAGDALAYLRTNKIRIIFTDITILVIPGMRFAEFFPKEQQFVFVSAHEEYALTSFRFNTLDYLVEPFNYQRFIQAAEKIRMNNPPDQPSENKKSYMLAKSNGQIIRINFDDILYIKGQREYVGIQLSNKRILVYKRMKEMENLLPENFKRIHVSFIINTDYLNSVASNHIITAGQSIPIGISYRPGIHRYLNAQTI
jgi:DNA-binding LytR/AlgR family response regulator